jgi:hypothetical protein
LSPPGVVAASFSQQLALDAHSATRRHSDLRSRVRREFKLNSYTLAGTQGAVPLDAMVNWNFTHTDTGVLYGRRAAFPRQQQLRVQRVCRFIAGRISDHFGGFAQVTYSGVDRATAWDNLDMRFVDSFKTGDTSVQWGLSLNNNPTIQDLWNSTPPGAFHTPAPTRANACRGATDRRRHRPTG